VESSARPGVHFFFQPFDSPKAIILNIASVILYLYCSKGLISFLFRFHEWHPGFTSLVFFHISPLVLWPSRFRGIAKRVVPLPFRGKDLGFPSRSVPALFSPIVQVTSKLHRPGTADSSGFYADGLISIPSYPPPYMACFGNDVLQLPRPPPRGLCQSMYRRAL